MELYTATVATVYARVAMDLSVQIYRHFKISALIAAYEVSNFINVIVLN